MRLGSPGGPATSLPPPRCRPPWQQTGPLGAAAAVAPRPVPTPRWPLRPLGQAPPASSPPPRSRSQGALDNGAVAQALPLAPRIEQASEQPRSVSGTHVWVLPMPMPWSRRQYGYGESMSHVPPSVRVPGLSARSRLPPSPSPLTSMIIKRIAATVALVKGRGPAALTDPALVLATSPESTVGLPFVQKHAARWGMAWTEQPSLVLHALALEALLDPLPEFGRCELEE